MAAACLPGAPARAADGDLDRSFSSDGRVSLASAGSFVPRAVALQRDGRIVVAGSSCRPEAGSGDGTCLSQGDASFRLARLTPDGGLDPEFGEGGLVTTRVGTGRSQAFDVLALPSGDIVAGGVARNGGGEDVLALVRYDARGALDRSFGTDGAVLQPAGAGFSALTALAHGPNGTLLAAGQSGQRMLVARFTAAGELDPAFGDRGVVVGGPAYGYGLGVAADPSGNAVVAGIAGDSADQRTFRFGVARLTPSGAPDESFGAEGFLEARPGVGSSYANAVALTSDGGWVAAGVATIEDGRGAMALVRGGPMGGTSTPLWTSLTTSGRGAAASDVVALQDGRSLVAGQVTPGGGGLVFGAARLRADGHLDPSWGEDGLTTIGWENHPWARATAVAVQPDGRVVTAGLGCSGGEGGQRCTGGRAVLLLVRQISGAAPTGPPPGADVTPPVAELSRVPRRIRRARLVRRGLRARVRADEPVSIDARLTGRRRSAGAGRPERIRLARAVRRRPVRSASIRLKSRPRTLRRARGGRLRLDVRLRDRAGNETRLRVHVVLA